MLPRISETRDDRVEYTIGFNTYSENASLLDSVGYQVCAILRDYKYADLDGATYLFDIGKDPRESKNIIDREPSIAIALQDAVRLLNVRTDSIVSTPEPG